MAKGQIGKRREIRLIQRSQNMERQQLGALQNQSGCDVGSENPVFFDPLSAIPHPLEVDRLQMEIVRLMRKARISPELIYAYLHTGLIVTEERYEHLSPEDRYGWDRAIVEYVKRSERSQKKTVSIGRWCPVPGSLMATSTEMNGPATGTIV